VKIRYELPVFALRLSRRIVNDRFRAWVLVMDLGRRRWVCPVWPSKEKTDEKTES
jgi:hypothetical protein